MSGGFFRGTSADQDTRFSNKEAKLLKSQKFAPELEHQVDMSRVKMDVIRPWIATRVTELLGFEDEVLINFIYGLLDGKDVDGKQIQIQLTGFMEKNTAKFMKELWALLRSAQNNVSGVPQQFLDAKEEETRKKKAETDRIAQEIQRRKEKDGREFEREKFSRMDGEDDIARSGKGASDLASKHSNARVSGFQPEEEREADGRLDSKARNGHSKSPKSDDNSPSPSRSTPSSIREGRSRSRSASVSSQSQRHSVSPPRQYQSPARRSLTPRRRYRSSPHHSISPRRRHSPRKPRSPSRRRSPYIRRRSNSRSRHRSPSPIRQRSPRVRRRSPPFIRRRSPSPLRRRSSPLRRRSRSPLRRRSPSPLRHRSPIKVHRRSPSPVRRRSPIRYKSPSPVRRRSPPPRSPKQQRLSPLHSPKGRLADSQNSPRQRNRSHSPDRSRSPLHRTRKSLSREHDDRSDGIESRRHRDILTTQRKRERRSPLHHVLEREPTENHDAGLKVLEKVAHKVQISLRSPQRDVKKQSDVRGRVPVPSDKSPIQSESPNNVQRTNPKISRRSRSLSKSPVRQTRERASRYDSPEASAEEKQSREASRQISDSSRKTSKELSQNARLKISNAHDRSPELKSRDKLAVDQSPAVRGHRDNSGLGKKDSGRKRDMDLRERHVRQLSHSSEEREYGPGKAREGRASLGNEHDRHLSAKQLSRNKSSAEEKEPLEQTDGHRGLEHETERRIQSKKKVVDKDQFDSDNSDSEETDTSKYHKIQNVEKRKHKKSDKRRRDSDESSGSDSQMDDRKEAKRRKKDEKRLRKEERRRRREERHRRRLERRTSKLKVKSVDTVTPPSDFEKNHSNADDSDADATIRKNSHPNDPDETESEQKKLEIELRKKALESLRAKKAISH